MNEDLDIREAPLSPEDLARIKDSIIIALLQRAGGKVAIPIAEIDAVKPGFFWKYRLHIPNTPTGELKIDARIGGELWLEVGRKQ
jgi:hypothetical protein